MPVKSDAAGSRGIQLGLRAAFGNQIALNGHHKRRLSNTLNVSFVGRVGANVLARIPEVGVGAVRFSLGRSTTRQEIEEAVDLLTQALA